MKKFLRWPALIIILVVLAAIAQSAWTWRYELARLFGPADADSAGGVIFRDDVLSTSPLTFIAEQSTAALVGDWQINQSAAVFRLDCPEVTDGTAERDDILQLRPTYAEAVSKAKRLGRFLPSVNLVDGACKQFDDGMMAAVELAAFRGELSGLPSPVAFARELLSKLRRGGPARIFLAAALELAGEPVELRTREQEAVRNLLAEFEADSMRSRPVGFYASSDELGRVWKFFRFLQQEFFPSDRIPLDLAGAIANNDELHQQYQALIKFYWRLSNASESSPLDELYLSARMIDPRARHENAVRVLALFPPSTSREVEFFNRVFPWGIKPPNANLMERLIEEIQSGKIDLRPRPGDGWYQQQVYALETLLMPGRGREAQKLLLSGRYKRRLVDAYQAMITTRRETHALRMGASKSAEIEVPPTEVQPQLRVEPCPTFFLRSARSYVFLREFLLKTIGAEDLSRLHRLTEEGPVAAPLQAELDAQINRLYGLYLISCEDIGLVAELEPGEQVDSTAAIAEATAWLKGLDSNPDLSIDCRVIVPIFVGGSGGSTRWWGTIGVRLAPLTVAYAIPPRIREASGPTTEWRELSADEMEAAEYLIPVLEFAEINVSGSDSFSRDEWRKICDRLGSRKAILQHFAETPSVAAPQ